MRKPMHWLARLRATPCSIEGRWIQVEKIVTSILENLKLNLIVSDEKDWGIPIKEYILEVKKQKIP